MQVQSLGWEDFLEKGMATHSSIPAWRISMDRGASVVHGVQELDMIEQLRTAQHLLLQTLVQLLSHIWVLWPHGLQHARLPCPSLPPRACSDSCLSNRWCHPAIPFSVVPVSSCLQSFPASGSFPGSWLFASCGQSIGTSVPVLLLNILGWSPSEWTGWTSLQSKGLSRVFSNTTVQKHQFFSAQPSLWSNSHIHTWLLEKPSLWLCVPLLAMWCLYSLIHCLGVISILLKSKCRLTSCLQSLSAVILEPKKIKSVTASTFFPSICHKVMGLDVMILIFFLF